MQRNKVLFWITVHRCSCFLKINNLHKWQTSTWGNMVLAQPSPLQRSFSFLHSYKNTSPLCGMKWRTAFCYCRAGREGISSEYWEWGDLCPWSDTHKHTPMHFSPSGASWEEITPTGRQNSHKQFCVWNDVQGEEKLFDRLPVSSPTAIYMKGGKPTTLPSTSANMAKGQGLRELKSQQYVEDPKFSISSLQS